MSSLDRLCSDLGYRFKEPRLLTEALTHRSAGSNNNERLEFLGDGVLNFVVAAALYDRYPNASEGELSRLRASLVKGETLADVATTLGLGEFLLLGSGELKSGGFRRASILADALEAVFGAIFLDAGFDVCRERILAVMHPYIENVPDVSKLKDPKTRLQEWLQSRRLALPEYSVIEVSGEAHKQRFVVSCTVDGLDQPVEASGKSRRRAEQAAAEKALEVLAGE